MKNLKTKTVQFRIDENTATVLKILRQYTNVSEFIRECIYSNLSQLLCKLISENKVPDFELNQLMRLI